MRQKNNKGNYVIVRTVHWYDINFSDMFFCIDKMKWTVYPQQVKRFKTKSAAQFMLRLYYNEVIKKTDFDYREHVEVQNIYCYMVKLFLCTFCDSNDPRWLRAKLAQMLYSIVTNSAVRYNNYESAGGYRTGSFLRKGKTVWDEDPIPLIGKIVMYIELKAALRKSGGL